MAEEEDAYDVTEILPVDVERPLFTHGPRLPLAHASEDESNEDALYACCSRAFDLVFVVEALAVAAYSGKGLAERSQSSEGEAATALPPLCRLPVTQRPLLMCAGLEGEGSHLAVASSSGQLDFFSMEKAAAGEAAKVFSDILNGEEVCELHWRGSTTCICVCYSGRVFAVDPIQQTNLCLHDVVDFKALSAGVERDQDIILLGGIGGDCSNLWALDVQSSDAWAITIEGVAEEAQDQLWNASLCGICPLPGGQERDIACLFVVEVNMGDPDAEEPEIETETYQAILRIDADAKTATVVSLSFNEIVISEPADRNFLHAVWVPEWQTIMMGCSSSGDITLLSRHPAHVEGHQVPCGWVALQPPEGKQLYAPQTVSQDAQTYLRGLCLLTSFKGEVTVSRRDANAPKLSAPPMVLIAASDGSISLRFCDHFLEVPKQPARPDPSKAGATAKAAAKAAPSPFAANASPSPFTSNASSSSPFGAGTGGSPFGSGGSLFGGNTSTGTSPFGAPAAAGLFGCGSTSSPSPFGGGGGTASSPFGAGGGTSSSPFGGGGGTASSPFGGGAGQPSWDSPQTPPINCQWNPWSDWTECTETCGGGDQGRQRDRKVIPENGGEECHGPRQESQACNEEECPSTTDVPVEDHATDISHTEGETGVTGSNKSNTANTSIVIESEEAVEKKKASLKFIYSGLLVLVVVAGGGLAASKLYEQYVKQKSPLYDEFGEPLVTDDYDTYDDEGY